MKELDGQIKKLMAMSQCKVDTEAKGKEPLISGITRAEFKVYSDNCDSKKDWECGETQYACKDYMCPRLKSEEAG